MNNLDIEQNLEKLNEIAKKYEEDRKLPHISTIRTSCAGIRCSECPIKNLCDLVYNSTGES